MTFVHSTSVGVVARGSAAALRSSMERAIARFCRTTGRNDTPVPGLSVGYIETPLAPTAYFYEPSLCICARGAKRVELDNSALDYDEDNFLLTSLGIPTVISVPAASRDKPYAALQLRLDLDIVRRVVADMEVSGVKATSSDSFESCMVTGPVTLNLLEAVSRFVSLLENPSDIPILSNLIYREIVYRVLTGPQGNRLRQIAQTDSKTSQVAKAVTWLRDNLAERLRIEELAKHSGLGVSTLHRHFRQLMMMSPLQYQKYLRLHEARRLMLSRYCDIGTAALAVGYQSVSQFNREYRRMFGVPPSRNIRALRTAVSV